MKSTSSKAKKSVKKTKPNKEVMRALDLLNPTFKRGETIEKLLFFMGQVSETSKQKIHSIKGDVIYLSDNAGQKETGVTYNLKGEEIEKFFLPHSYSKIIKNK
jgi:ribosomal protein L19